MRIVVLLGLLVSLTLRAQVWEPLNGPLAVEVSEVAVNSNDVLFFITTEGLHRSFDNGGSWELLNNGLPTAGLSDLLVAPNDHVFLFVFNAGFRLLYRSVDNGTSWTLLNNGDPFIGGSCLAANAQGVLFMGMNSGNLNRSFDDGDTWTLTPGTAAVFGFIVADFGDTLFAGYNDSFNGGAYRSFDAGVTWSPMNYGFSSPHCIGVNAIGHVFIGTEGSTRLVRSTDGGITWTQLDTGLAWEILAITFNSSGHVFISTGQSGVLRSVDNGDTWSLANNGLGARCTYQFAVNSSNHLFAASSDDLYRSLDSGLNWSGTNASIVQSNICSIQVNDSNDYFAALQFGGLRRSLDSGATWQTSNVGLAGAWVTDIAPSPSGALYVTTIGGPLVGGVFGSVDNGNTWNMLTDTAWAGGFSVAVNSAGDVYASFEPSMSMGMVQSSDNGATWTGASPGPFPCAIYTDLVIGGDDHLFARGRYCIDVVYSTAWGIQELVPGGVNAIMTALSARADGTVLAARDWSAGPRVFRALNNLPIWQEASYGLPDTTVNVLLCHPTQGLSLAGTPVGVYITNNDGDDWWPFNDGLTNLDVRAFAIDQNGYILAGTNGGGVFRAALPVSVAEVEPNSFTVEQNTPNPCDGSTTIPSSLRTAAHVQLTLLDAHGRTIAHLMDVNQPPGRNTVEVATARLAPGLYAYTLTVDGQRVTKRMMVVH